MLAALNLATPAAADDPSFVSVGTGWWDWNDNEGAADFRLEYRSSYKFAGFAKPWAGIEANTDGGGYGAAGVLMDIFFGRRLVFTPQFGVGLYSRGSGKDLGTAIEFRSQVELGYRFDDRSRLSIAVSHISNASLSDTNPGTEIANIYYHIPIDGLFGD